MELIKKAKLNDKYIYTDDGVFKLRKNGRLTLVIDPDNRNRDIVRVTPVNLTNN